MCFVCVYEDNGGKDFKQSESPHFVLALIQERLLNYGERRFPELVHGHGSCR